MSDDPRLTEALRSKARSFDTHLTGIDEVIGRAHAIRRRRRAAVGMAAAVAVAAVAVPGTLLLRPGTSVVHPIGPAPSATATTAPGKPSPTPSSSTTSGPTLAQISRGADLGVSYLQGDTVHFRGGATTRLPAGRRWISFTGYHGGVLATSTDGAGSTLTEFDNTGKVVASHPGSGPVVSPDGMQTAWWWQDGTGGGGNLYSGITTGMGNGESKDPTPAGVPVVPVGFLPAAGPVYNAQPGRVRILGTPQPGETVAHMYVASGVASTGLVAGQTDASGTQGVVDAATGKPQWTAPEGWVLAGFSNDGTYLAAQHQAADGSIDAVGIFDARTGRKVGSYTPRSPLEAAGPIAWEDDTHLVAEVYDTGAHTWGVVRLGADGTLDRATDPVGGAPDDPPVVFAAPGPG